MPSRRIKPRKRTHAQINDENQHRDAGDELIAPQLVQQLPPQARRVLQDIQLRNQELDEENQHLREENQHYEAVGRTLKKSRGQRTVPDNRDETAIRQAGKMHSVFKRNLGVTPSIIQRNLDEADSDLQRIIIQEYIESLPAQFRAEYQSDRVVELFLSGMGAIRSSLVSRLKGECLLDVFGEDIATAVRVHPRGSDPLCHALLGFVNNTYQVIPPFIMADGEGPPASRLFRVPYLAKALRACVFGPSSVQGDSMSVVGNDTYGKKWKVNRVTPGAMAFIATVCRYIFSPDTEFTNFGGATNISYHNAFNQYLDLAETIRRTRDGRETYALWDRIVFAGIDVPYERPAEAGLEAADALVEEINAQIHLEEEELNAENDEVQSDHSTEE